MIESAPEIWTNEVQASATKHSCVFMCMYMLQTGMFLTCGTRVTATLLTYLFFHVEGVEVVVICQFYSTVDVFQSKQTNTVHSIHRPERKRQIHDLNNIQPQSGFYSNYETNCYKSDQTSNVQLFMRLSSEINNNIIYPLQFKNLG